MSRLVIPEWVASAVSAMTGKACKQLLYPDGTMDGHLAYQSDVAETIAGALRNRHQPRSILDIGCGLGMLPTILAKHFAVEQLHLLDGSGTVDLRYSMGPRLREDTVAWSDVRYAVAVAGANIPEVRICGYGDGDPLNFDADTIISMRAWGHHFALAAYADRARRCLELGGIIIIGAPRGFIGARSFDFAGGVRVVELTERSRKSSLAVFAAEKDKRWR